MRLACNCGFGVHAHVVPAFFPASQGSCVPPLWPGTTQAPDAKGLRHRRVQAGLRHHRSVMGLCRSTPRRVAEQPAMGLAQQGVSPMPERPSGWLNLAEAGFDGATVDAPAFGHARRFLGPSAMAPDEETA